MTTSSGNEPIKGKNNSLDEEAIIDHGKSTKKFPVRATNLDALLPDAIPEARILRYGVYRQSTAGNGLISTEKNFIPSLNAKRMSCLDRPIVFIGHTFGGIFMEQALVAGTEKDLLSIWKSIAGIVFLSTPFSFSDDAQILLIHQLKNSSDEPRSSKIKEVGYGPQLLEDIQAKFVTQVQKAKVPLVCFYEEHLTEIKRKKLQSEVCAL